MSTFMDTQKFTEKVFNIPELTGISTKNIEEHLKLYKGYVTNANLILNKIEEYTTDTEKNSFILAELQRRFSFEFDGMRNHEYYFTSLENGHKDLNKESDLYKKIENQFGSYDSFMSKIKNIAMTRGVGWAMLYYDKQSGSLLTQWVEEQHLGHLVGLSPILALDMWEHAYVYDYATSEKKKYIEAFFANLNWDEIEKNFKNAQ